MDAMVAGNDHMETTEDLKFVPSQVNTTVPLQTEHWKKDVVVRGRLAGFARDIVPGTWMMTIPSKEAPYTKAYRDFIGDKRTPAYFIGKPMKAKPGGSKWMAFKTRIPFRVSTVRCCILDWNGPKPALAVYTHIPSFGPCWINVCCGTTPYVNLVNIRSQNTLEALYQNKLQAAIYHKLAESDKHRRVHSGV
jgi:hypothetical protein